LKPGNPRLRKKIASSKKVGRRATKTEATRRFLIDATFLVVGEYGFADTTIARITSRARVAQGTFYNYFSSQQDLFEQLLPSLGEQLIEHLEARIGASADVAEFQRHCLTGFVDFIRESSVFYRILIEAEVYVPKAHRRYLVDITNWHRKALKQFVAVGAIEGFEERELEVLAYSIVAMHHYLLKRFAHWSDETTRLPHWVIETQQRLLMTGLLGSLGEKRPGPKGRAKAGKAAAARAGNVAPFDTVKFAPRIDGPRPYLEHGAFTSQLNCRTTLLDNGGAMIELELDRSHLSTRGTASGGLITAVAEAAAITALCHDRRDTVTVESVAFGSTLIRSITDGTMVAVAIPENAGRNIRFVNVRITQDKPDGELIATVQITFRVLWD
jgi:AcrR family transcriptional regulator/acyl-coenzyme A thioesterase PaaI-like protein